MSDSLKRDNVIKDCFKVRKGLCVEGDGFISGNLTVSGCITVGPDCDFGGSDPRLDPIISIVDTYSACWANFFEMGSECVLNPVSGSYVLDEVGNTITYNESVSAVKYTPVGDFDPMPQDVILHVQSVSGVISDISDNMLELSDKQYVTTDKEVKFAEHETIKFEETGPMHVQDEKLILGEEDFTIEFHVRINSNTSADGTKEHIFTQTNSPEGRPSLDLMVMDGGERGILKLREYSGLRKPGWEGTSADTSNECKSTVKLEDDRWYHVTIMREVEPNMVSLFVDGVRQSAFIPEGSFDSDEMYIGGFADWHVAGNERYNLSGHVADFRIAKGVNYVDDFVPSVELLTTATSAEHPASFHFNPTNTQPISIDPDLLTFEENEDFTIEFWVYRLATNEHESILANGAPIQQSDNSNYRIMYNANGLGYRFIHDQDAPNLDTGAVTDNKWHHVAFVRDENILKTYVDGDLKDCEGEVSKRMVPYSVNGFVDFGGNATGTYSSPDSYFADFRVTRKAVYQQSGFDLPTRHEPCAAALTEEDQSNIFDLQGEALLSGTDDFSIQMWFKTSDTGSDTKLLRFHNEDADLRKSLYWSYRGAYPGGNNSRRWFQFTQNNGSGSTNVFLVHANFLAPTPLQDDTWHHLMISRSNTTEWRMWVDGEPCEYKNNRDWTNTPSGDNSSGILPETYSMVGPYTNGWRESGAPDSIVIASRDIKITNRGPCAGSTFVPQLPLPVTTQSQIPVDPQLPHPSVDTQVDVVYDTDQDVGFTASSRIIDVTDDEITFSEEVCGESETGELGPNLIRGGDFTILPVPGACGYDFDGAADTVQADVSLDGDYSISFWVYQETYDVDGGWAPTLLAISDMERGITPWNYSHMMFRIASSSTNVHWTGAREYISTSNKYSTSITGDGQIVLGEPQDNDRQIKGGKIELNTWTHVAFTRQGDRHMGYIDGVKVVEWIETPVPIDGTMFIACQRPGYGHTNGKYQDFKLSKTPEHVNDFTPAIPDGTTPVHSEIFLHADCASEESCSDYTRYWNAGDTTSATLPNNWMDTESGGWGNTFSFQYRLPDLDMKKSSYLFSIGNTASYRAIRIMNGEFWYHLGDPGSWGYNLAAQPDAASNQVEPGRWYTLTVVYGGSINDSEFYIDGVPADRPQTNGTPGSASQVTPSITSGYVDIMGAIGSANAAGGDIRNVRVYKGRATDGASIDPSSDALPAGTTELLLSSPSGNGHDNQQGLSFNGGPEGCWIKNNSRSAVDMDVIDRQYIKPTEVLAHIDPNHTSDEPWARGDDYTMDTQNGVLELSRNGADASGAKQYINTTPGKRYVVKYDVISTTNYPRVYAGNDADPFTNALGPDAATPGSYEYSFVAEDQSTLISAGVSNSQTGDIVFDNISVQEALTQPDNPMFPIGERLLMINMQAGTEDISSVGNYEFVEVESCVNQYTLKLKQVPTKHFLTGDRIYLAYQQHVNTVTINEDVTIRPVQWNPDLPQLTGVLWLNADTVHVKGSVNGDGRGYRGGRRDVRWASGSGPRGEGIVTGGYNVRTTAAHFGGGGGGGYITGNSIGDAGMVAGAGSHVTQGVGGGTGYAGGINGKSSAPLDNWDQLPDFDSKLFMGPGGGQGGADSGSPHDTGQGRGGFGGNGGAVVIIDAASTIVSKNTTNPDLDPWLSSRGGGGASHWRSHNQQPQRCEPGNGASGAGGTILITGDIDNRHGISTRGGVNIRAGGYGKTITNRMFNGQCTEHTKHVQSLGTDSYNSIVPEKQSVKLLVQSDIQDTSLDDIILQPVGAPAHDSTESPFADAGSIHLQPGDRIGIGTSPDEFRWLHDQSEHTFTVETWYKRHADATPTALSQIIVGNLHSSNDSGWNLTYSSSNQNIIYQIAWGELGNIWSLRSEPQSIENDKWYHIILQKDGDRVSLYLDGVLVDSAIHTLNPILDDPLYPLSIGSDHPDRTSNVYVHGLRIVRGQALYPTPEITSFHAPVDIDLVDSLISTSYESGHAPANDHIGIGEQPIRDRLELVDPAGVAALHYLHKYVENIFLDNTMLELVAGSSILDKSLNERDITTDATIVDTSATTGPVNRPAVAIDFDVDDTIQLDVSDDWNLGADDFTIEYWMRTPGDVETNNTSSTPVVVPTASLPFDTTHDCAPTDSDGVTNTPNESGKPPACEDVYFHLQSDTMSPNDPIEDHSAHERVLSYTDPIASHDSTNNLLTDSSIAIDGRNGHISVGEIEDWKFLHDGTCDYTVEFWMKKTQNAPADASGYTESNNNGTVFSTCGTSYTTGVRFFFGNNGSVGYSMVRGVGGSSFNGLQTTGLVNNVWYHVAITFKSDTNVASMYIDGQLRHENTASNPPNTGLSRGTLILGQTNREDDGFCHDYIGNIQDFRITKGIVYSSDFIADVDTKTITPVPMGTNIIDVYGDDQWADNRGWMMYNNGQRLDFMYTVDGTLKTFPVTDMLQNYSWYRVMVSRVGGILKSYVNGVEKHSIDEPGAIDYDNKQLTVAKRYTPNGHNFDDYRLNNLLILKGIGKGNLSEVCQNTTLLLQTDLDGDDYQDNSQFKHSITETGNIEVVDITSHPDRPAGIDHAIKLFAPEHLTLPANSMWNLSDNDFTIEFHMKLDSLFSADTGTDTAVGIIDAGSASNDKCWFVYGNEENLSFLYKTPTTPHWEIVNILNSNRCSGAAVVDKWYHIVVTRTQGKISSYVNGELVHRVSETRTINYNGSNLLIGKRNSSSGNSFQGLLTDIRILNGMSVYVDERDMMNPDERLETLPETSYHLQPTVTSTCSDGECKGKSGAEDDINVPKYESVYSTVNSNSAAWDLGGGGYNGGDLYVDGKLTVDNDVNLATDTITLGLDEMTSIIIPSGKFDGDLVPTLDTTYDVGTDALRWQTIWSDSNVSRETLSDAVSSETICLLGEQTGMSTVSPSVPGGDREVECLSLQDIRDFKGAHTIVNTYSAQWTKEHIHLLSRGSFTVDTPSTNAGFGTEREFLCMQSNNFAGDATYSELNHTHTLVLPFDTHIKKIVLRASATAGDDVKIGIHSNRGLEAADGYAYVFFMEKPIEEQMVTFQENFQTKVITFSPQASAREGDTIGISLSAQTAIDATSVTIVLNCRD